MKGLFSVLTALLLVAGCKASEPPTQVVYRFDDHRYLELKGWDCEGELWYTDTLRGIHTEPVSQFYRIFTKKYVHPSEKYIAITGWGVGGFRVSKDYGQTWQIAQFSPGENDLNGMNAPQQEDVLSFTVVNDQVFCRPNIDCICRPNRLTTRALPLVVLGLNIPLTTELGKR